MNNKLPDTPWHVGYAKKEEDDPRRHRARCIHNKKNKCSYMKYKCIGSSHCAYYAETYDDWDIIQKERQTIEQEETLRIVEYKKNLQNRILKYAKSFDLPQRYVKAKELVVCPVCEEKIKKYREEKHIAECDYCGAVFCDKSHIHLSMANWIIVGESSLRTTSKSQDVKGVFIVSKKRLKRE